MFVVVWQPGTTWDAATEQVVLPDGGRAGMGDFVQGGGGYHAVADLGVFGVDDAGIATITPCADRLGPEVAVIQSPVSIIPAPVDDPAVADAEETIRTYLDHAAAGSLRGRRRPAGERCTRERAPQRPAPAPARRARPRRPRQRTRGVVLLDGDLHGADDARSGRHGCVRSDVRRRRSHRHRLLPRRRVRGRSRGARAPAATPTRRRRGGLPDHPGGRLGRGRPRRRRRTRDRRQPQAGCRAVRARHLQHGARHPAVLRRVARTTRRCC